MQKKITHILEKDNFSSFPVLPTRGDRVFLRGDLGAGKTTLSKHLVSLLLGQETAVKSPTYVYYNRYGANIYHFDLYRLKSYEDFVNIGGEEILDNPENICLIEWPEILESRYTPTVDIELLKTDQEDTREVKIIVNSC